MLPVIGQMRALQAVGKLGTMINGVGRLGSTLNKAGLALQNPYTQQIIGTLYGAHLDSMEEIVRGYDEQYQYALDLGFNEDDARKFASVYASESYNDAWAYGILFNAIELNSMLRGIKEAPVNSISIETGLKSNIKGLAQKGKTFVLDSETSKLNRKLIPSIGLHKTKDFFSVACLYCIPLDLICFHVKFEAASIAFVYNSILRLVGVVYDTVFAVLYIGVDFYIVICGIPAVQFFLCRCGPEDCTVEDTAVLEAVRKSADIDTTAFSEVLHCHLHFLVFLDQNLSSVKCINIFLSFTEINVSVTV